MHYGLVKLETVRHKPLRRFIETGRPKGVIEPQRLIRMIAFIVSAASFEELAVPPNFGFHALKGNRAGTYAMTVTANWRLTFTKADDETITDLDLEDYHGN